MSGAPVLTIDSLPETGAKVKMSGAIAYVPDDILAQPSGALPHQKIFGASQVHIIKMIEILADDEFDIRDAHDQSCSRVVRVGGYVLLRPFHDIVEDTHDCHHSHPSCL
jgi:hypothetical protein